MGVCERHRERTESLWVRERRLTGKADPKSCVASEVRKTNQEKVFKPKGEGGTAVLRGWKVR